MQHCLGQLNVAERLLRFKTKLDITLKLTNMNTPRANSCEWNYNFALF